MNKTPALGYAVTQEDIDKAYKAKNAQPNNLQLRNNYINLLKARGEQKRAG
jgi:hypothetical protein